MLDRPEDLAPALEALSARLGPRLSTGASILDQHSRGEAHHAPRRPDAVAFPETTEEVADIVKICARHRVPITPYAVGSSLEGQTLPVAGGLSLDMNRMNQVLAVHAEDLDAVVQPGVTRQALNDEIRQQGLMFAVDPGADASLGGMAATRASGTTAVRYGTMREAVMGLEVVLADGRVIRTGGRARKSSAGYDLTRLFVGSEGTLGVITELTLRLYGLPEAVSAATCAFPNVRGAVDSVIEAIQIGLPLARIELIDAVYARALNAHADLGLPEAPHLFLEFHGSEAGVAEQSARFGEIAEANGGGGYAWASRMEDRNRLWKARHDAYWAARKLRPGAEAYVTDVCVPISALADAIETAEAETARLEMPAPLLGHVGDGNFHLQIMIDVDAPEERRAADAVAEKLARRALELGGTVTGEHGVGLGKMKLMRAEHGDAWDVMADLKRALDPQDILNPGKIVAID